MGNPVRRKYTTLNEGVQAPLNLDWLPIAQTLIAVWAAGDATYSVEATLDDINDPTAEPRWFTLKDFPVGTMGSKYAAIYEPWLFLRINFEIILADVELKVQQAWNNGPRG
jgi:hypothetical protein